MKRHAYIQHLGTALVINTLFAGPKRFPIDSLKDGDSIDLISLKKNTVNPSFFLTITDDPWNRETIMEVGFTVDSNGNIEYYEDDIRAGKSYHISCYIP